MPESSPSAVACGMVFTSKVPLAVADTAVPLLVWIARDEASARAAKHAKGLEFIVRSSVAETVGGHSRQNCLRRDGEREGRSSLYRGTRSARSRSINNEYSEHAGTGRRQESRLLPKQKQKKRRQAGSR